MNLLINIKNFLSGRKQKKIIIRNHICEERNVKNISIVLYAGYTAETYLTEWLSFHLQSGIDHIYVYDSTYSIKKLVIDQKFSQKTTVIPHDYVWRPLKYFNAHSLAYAHAIRNYGHLYKWMIFLDSDEFIYTKSGCSLNEALEKYLSTPALAIPWLMFDFGGNDSKPTVSTFHAYRERLLFPNQSKIKCIVQPRFVTAIINDHIVEVSNGKQKVVDQYGNHITSTTYKYNLIGDIRINHYYTKSKEEFINKIKNRSMLDTYDAAIINKKINSFNKSDKVNDTNIINYINMNNIIL